ncbi:PLP-dependent aminotransferase family protein [Kutzneria kofuensis]|uniref:GntR family transcriptional regulator/MocR family aminotransferase n=1 Tax=Kutzneria kofuensis TaxID=103725 RepID=A0A7W9KE62_9PSEU|nr:PLP-dependent aminotransferase family protein [Kutzneria kofuensis]MBB5890906.1 GntR family transcriptional regulator/MocR family aminotransferase [Kutzneria kofuensis]
MPKSWTSGGFELHLDLEPGVGRRAALERSLREAIRSGRLAAGTQLPSSRALAADLGLSRGTVVQAYEQLLAEGYLTSRSRTHTEVAAVPGARVRTQLRSATNFSVPYDLAPGNPDVSQFPRSTWASALRHAVTIAADEDLRYGDPRGHPQLRRALADYLGRVRGVRISSQAIVVCTGFTNGLRLIAAALRDRGGRVMAVEDYGLPFHVDAIEHAGLRTETVRLDDDGLVVDELPNADAVLVTASHQLPWGTRLHPARRGALVDWARDNNAIVVEDDYDGEFRYDRQPIGAIQGLAPEHVIYAGTASKSLAPAMRMAWLAVPERLLEPIVQIRLLSERQCPTFEQLALAQLVDGGGLDRHLRRMRTHYRKRRDFLLDALATSVPQVRPIGIAAGLHVTLLLPDGTRDDDIRAVLADHGVGAHPLSDYARAGTAPPGLVIGYATPPGHAFPAAVQALVTALAKLV